MNTTLEPYILFGSNRPWLPPPWTTTDDRVRGGASQSYLSALPDNQAHFHGHLDTSTLGGAGFASQFSPSPQVARSESGNGEEEGSGWDLSAYDGIDLQVGNGDGKVYTLILKDEGSAGKREEDGREKAGINWEVDFTVGGEGKDGGNEKDDGAATGGGGDDEWTRIWIAWQDFKATYRGKEVKDAGELKREQVRRVGFMMRSYFGKQQGDFSLVLRSLCARTTPFEREEEKGEYTNAVGWSPGSVNSQDAGKGNEPLGGKERERERGTGWLGWFSELCTVS